MEQTKEEPKSLKDLKHNLRNPLYIAHSLITTDLQDISQLNAENQNGVLEKTKAILLEASHEIRRSLDILRKLKQISVPHPCYVIGDNGNPSVSVAKVLDKIVETARVLRLLDHIDVIRIIPSDLPDLKIEPTDLEEVFYNLIANAAQAMRDGGSLVVRAEAVYHTQPRLFISFEDSGCGIAEEVLPYIFEPFYTNRCEGSGFGLYIVKQLVERNGGKISVTSELNRGTKFTLCF